MKKLMTLALLLWASLAATAQKTLTVDGMTRNYLEYIPANLGEKRPLLISCHGMNQDAAYQKGMLKIETVADTAKFVVVFPNGIDKAWDISGRRDINFILALIDEMVARYHINRNQVFLSGFSMGGMLTYHAMNLIADKIAAFAPISGYPIYGASYQSSRPIPIIHTHGTGDDVVVFGKVQSVLDGWIARNECAATPVTVKSYRGAPHITRHTWRNSTTGIEVVLMEMADKGHWISNDYGVLTGDEIWKFCKRYALDMKDPEVSITSPVTGAYYTIDSGTQSADITISARAEDPDGSIAKVMFYEGEVLIGTSTSAPYTFEYKGVTPGHHTVKAVAVDDEGRTATSSPVSFSVLDYGSLSQVFGSDFDARGAGVVPSGWVTYDGKEKRVGGPDTYSLGCRILQMTGAVRDFNHALYIRNTSGAASEGYAKYGSAESQTPLALQQGRHLVRFMTCNWNCVQQPVKFVLRNNGTNAVVATKTVVPTCNIGNNAANDFSGATQVNMEVDVPQTAQYSLEFYTADAAWADAMIANVSVFRIKDATAVSTIDREPGAVDYYDLSGRKTVSTAKGIVIRKSADGKGRKVVMP